MPGPLSGGGKRHLMLPLPTSYCLRRRRPFILLDTWPGIGLSCDLDGLYFDLQGFATRVVELVGGEAHPGQEWLGRLLDLLLQLKKEAAVQQKAARAEGSCSWADWCEKGPGCWCWAHA